MAEGKNFLIRIELDIHSVDYRFKHLNYRGNIALRVHALSSTAITIPATPDFPVHFQEKLIFEKVVDGMKSLSEIEKNLDDESIKMELVQWPGHFSGRPEVQAHFRTKLSEILFQDFSEKGNLKVRLEPVDKFAGTSGGSLEVSTKIIVAELTSYRPRKSRKQEVTSGNRFPCRRLVKSQNTCYCVISRGLEKKKCSSMDKPNNRFLQPEKIICCNNCRICKSYFGYFHRELFLNKMYRSCCCRKARCICGGAESPIPYRQAFYENLDLSYRNLCDKKLESTIFVDKKNFHQ